MSPRVPALAAVVLAAAPAAAAEGDDRPPSSWFVEASGGPAFASYGSVDAAGLSEHRASGGSAVGVGGGYGIELRPLRVDLGLRVSHLRFSIAGRYDATHREDGFRATYDYVFPTVTATFTTRLRSRVDLFGGLSLGSATFVSDIQGASIEARQLPVFGTFEGGIELAVAPWLAVRPTIAWVPPFEALNVVAATVGVRGRL